MTIRNRTSGVRAMNKLLRNSMITPDGKVLISRSRHDYVSYKDKNGETYMVDGGIDYLRRSVNQIPAEDTSLYVGDPHEILRDGVSWGVRIENAAVFIPISQLSRAHILNIVLDGYLGRFIDLMAAEVQWRDDHETVNEARELEKLREESYG